MPDYQKYGTHDFRRGHAEARCSYCFHLLCTCYGLGLTQDMRRCGADLAVILSAGQWKSAAFLNYLNLVDLEADTALAAAIDSDDEEWVD